MKSDGASDRFAFVNHKFKAFPNDASTYASQNLLYWKAIYLKYKLKIRIEGHVYTYNTEAPWLFQPTEPETETAYFIVEVS